MALAPEQDSQAGRNKLPSEVDVLVLGSGASGLTAAITAAVHGCSVLVAEKGEHIGGVTAWSGGAGWLPGNPHLSAGTAEDDTRQARAYLKALLGNRYQEPLIEAFLREAPAMVHFLEEKSSVRFQSFPSPDYHQEIEGAARANRSLIPVAFDARVLGASFRRLRRPFREMLVFGGMQVEPSEALDLQRAAIDWPSFKTAARLIGHYAFDILRFGRSTRLIRGAALAARLLKSADELGIAIVTCSPGKRLLIEDNHVVGAIVLSKGIEHIVRARRGVILATGGFSANAEWRQRHFQMPEAHYSFFPNENAGDGLTIGLDAGAVLGPVNAHNGYWTPISEANIAGELRRWPHFAFDRCKPGSIIVDNSGKRFVNESASYHQLVSAMHDLNISRAYLIANRQFLHRYGMGLARPFPYPHGGWVKAGYLVKAQTLAALAAQLDIDAECLASSVARINHFAETGVDEEFDRGGNIYNRSLGDPEHGPNPCLGAIGRGPYYAVTLHPGNAGTALGLRTNEHGEVVDTNGEVVPGLYACGLDMHSIMRGSYPGAGAMIGPSMTFGYIAGKKIAG